MYCSTCGAQVPDGHSRCDTCGAAVSRAPGYGVPAQITINNTNTVAPGAAVFATPVNHLTCPRCGFQGEGVSYFSQGGPIMGALFLALLTLPFMGAGGLVYYLMRHDYRACPRCGNSWGKRSEHARALSAGLALNEAAPQHASTHEPEMREDARLLRWAAYLIFAFAAMMTLIGMGEGEGGMIVTGLLAAGGGALLWKKANSAREQRREKLLMQLQQPVLRLASQRNGVLTVTDVAAALSWPMPRAEKVLNSLEDGLRVASSVTDEGVIVYEFRELMHAPRMSASEMDTLLNPGAPPNQAQRSAMPLPHDGTLSA
ncbi:MAG TPA: zinc ribbon domain-containing protein [Longimicrobium sp.]